MNGPLSAPPSDTFVYCWPRARAVGSVHWSCGASKFRLLERTMKLDARPVRTLNRPPLKFPRETSYGVVTSDVETFASRGRLLPPKFIPLSVVAFCAESRPRTENPFELPSALGMSWTPGSDAANAARSPIWLADTAF